MPCSSPGSGCLAAGHASSSSHGHGQQRPCPYSPEHTPPSTACTAVPGELGAWQAQLPRLDSACMCAVRSLASSTVRDLTSDACHMHAGGTSSHLLRWGPQELWRQLCGKALADVSRAVCKLLTCRARLKPMDSASVDLRECLLSACLPCCCVAYSAAGVLHVALKYSPREHWCMFSCSAVACCLSVAGRQE